MPASLKLVRPAPEAAFIPTGEVRLACERAEDAAAVDALIERAFGPGRYAKAAERLREGNALRPDLSITAFGAEEIVGAVRQWPITIGGAAGVFLGPIAVEAAWRKHGVGALMIARAAKAASGAGEAFILLVGDMPLFGPHGFEAVPAERLVMPGPVNANRILWRALKDGGLDGVSGAVRANR